GTTRIAAPAETTRATVVALPRPVAGIPAVTAAGAATVVGAAIAATGITSAETTTITGPAILVAATAAETAAARFGVTGPTRRPVVAGIALPRIGGASPERPRTVVVFGHGEPFRSLLPGHRPALVRIQPRIRQATECVLITRPRRPHKRR